MGPPNHKQGVQLQVELVGKPAAGQEVWVGKVEEAQAVAGTFKFS